MQHFNTNDIQGFSKIYRLNLINSITGYKSANLIGTRSNSGEENVAIFSSITHLGAIPPYFILHYGQIQFPVTPTKILKKIKSLR